MAIIRYKTENGGNPYDNPRVFFTCHPDDMGVYFEKICNYLFDSKNNPCTVCYTENMSEPLDNINLEVDLPSMRLFVIPITRNLFKSKCRALTVDIAFAKEHNISILPFMMDGDMLSEYEKSENFGRIQYLDPISGNQNLSFKERLRNHLADVLIDTDQSEEIRNEFDSYIFLSYRKVNRDKAKRLMKKIHDIPGCQDVAIWYDGFLALGEDWRENILLAMKKSHEKSNLFTLLVAPELLDYVDDGKGGLKKNFIMEYEYPDAQGFSMTILPVEMEPTDRNALSLEFPHIPDCLDASSEVLEEAFMDALNKMCDVTNDKSPKHNYLIGLAYLNGIDVEINVDRAIRLITSAAESGYPDAMMRLSIMYYRGDGVECDYSKALYWGNRLYEHHKKEDGDAHVDTLFILNYIASIQCQMGLSEATDNYKKIYELKKKNLPENDSEILMAMINLGSSLIRSDVYQAKEKLEEALASIDDLEKACVMYPDVLTAMSNLANVYGALGEDERAMDMQKSIYNISSKLCGKKSIEALSSLSYISGKCKDPNEALSLCDDLYQLCKTNFGKENPYTLTARNNLASKYYAIGEIKKAIEIMSEVYDLRLKILGPKSPDTLLSRMNLAVYYMESDRPENLKKAIMILEKVYKAQEKLLGKTSIDTLTTKSNLALAYYGDKDYKQAIKLQQEAILEFKLGNYPETHPKNILFTYNLAYIYYEKHKAVDFKRYFAEKKIALVKAYEHIGRAYKLSVEAEGDFSKNTIKYKQKLDEIEFAYRHFMSMYGN